MRRLPITLGALMIAVLLAAISLGTTHRAAAQTTVPDLTQFGFPKVVGTVNYTPGTTETITAGTQQVVLPADFISKTVKFELLEGDPAAFAASLPITDQGRTIIVAWAFRVTDTASGSLIARFDKPVQWSVTDTRIVTGSAVYNTSPANPPVVTANAAPGTISGTTLSHPFGGAGVGWLVLGPPLAPAATPASTATEAPAAPTATEVAASPTATSVPTATPTEAPVAAPTEAPVIAPAPVTPPGMPSTGSADFGSIAALLALLATGVAASGLLLRRKRAS